MKEEIIDNKDGTITFIRTETQTVDAALYKKELVERLDNLQKQRQEQIDALDQEILEATTNLKIIQ